MRQTKSIPKKKGTKNKTREAFLGGHAADDFTRDNRKQIVNAFRKGTQNNTREYIQYDKTYYEYPYPIPGGKFAIDEDFGRNEICIRCKKVWTDELMKVAKKICSEFGIKVSSPLSVSGFGTSYNFFTLHL